MIILSFLVALLKIQTGLSFQSSFIRDCLESHNDVRALHGVPPLEWDTDIAVEAQKWANHLAAIDQMQHDTSSRRGENLFYMYGGDPKEACGRAVKNWYQEMKNYDFVTPHSDDSTSHFSQVIWKGTQKVGIGTAQSKSGNFFLVARYDPKGNVDGTFNDNVPKPLPASYLTQLEDDNERNSSELGTSLSVGQTDSMATANLEKQLKHLPQIQDQRQDLRLYQPSILLPKRGKTFKVEIRFPLMEFTEDMLNPASQDYIEAKRMIIESVIQTYDDDDDFLEAQVHSLRNGSVIATLGLLFSTKSAGHLDRLTNALNRGHLGKFVVSPAYESAVALPDGYLRLSLPEQRPEGGVCPQPCSNPQHCYQGGCLVSCCAFHPVTSPAMFHPQPHPAPLPPSPVAPPLPACSGACDGRCSPECDVSCCDEMKVPFVASSNPPQSPVLVPNPPLPGANCPSSCHFACYPQCTPECCNELKTINQCPVPCPALCAPDCSQGCCDARKSAIHRYQKMAALLRAASKNPVRSLSGRKPVTRRFPGFYSRRPLQQFHPLTKINQRRPATTQARRRFLHKQAMSPAYY